MRCGSGEMSQRDRSSASVRSVSRRPCQFFHVQDIELIFILLPKSDSHFFQRLSLMDHPLSATISRGPPAAISHVPSALYHRCRYLSTIYPSITCLIIWILPDNFTDHYYFVASLQNLVSYRRLFPLLQLLNENSLTLPELGSHGLPALYLQPSCTVAAGIMLYGANISAFCDPHNKFLLIFHPPKAAKFSRVS